LHHYVVSALLFTMSDFSKLPYRPGVGIMLANAANQVFVGQRLDSVVEAWQMPQGGIDPGEDPLPAALRELEEETGVAAQYVQIIAQTATPLDYDLPEHLIGKLWQGRYRGQRQHWFLVRFTGSDGDINIATPHPEFRAWQWAALDQLAKLIVPFKRELYAKIIAELGSYLR
jgi:putative (di)nucleoside polyphosphate hydrolase